MKLLMIGLDAAEGRIVDELVGDGRMPALGELRQRGITRYLNPLPGLGDDATWTTLTTGVLPGRHGRFHHEQPVRKSYSLANVARTDTTQPPFWKAFADEGLSVAAIDVPKSPLAGLANGLEVADWMPHGQDLGHSSVFPAGHGYEESFIPESGFDCDGIVATPQDVESHAAAIRRRGVRRRKVLVELANGDWDVFIAVVAETHCAGHHFWHLHDPSHPSHDAPVTTALGDLVASEYEAADALLTELRSFADPDTYVVIFAPIGMGPNYSADHLLDAILERIEPEPPVAPPERAVVKRFLPGAVKRLAYGLFPGVVSSVVSPHAQRKVWRLPHDAVSAALRLNVRGREPRGTIAPGKEYDAWCARIAELLLELENTATGGRVVREVVQVADRYPGPESGRFADLLVVWETGSPVTGVRSDSLGEFEGLIADRTGNHASGGWFTIAGPGIEPSAESVTAEIADLAPTVSSLMGIDPTGTDGISLALGR
ncbi:MAG: hypothetical protein HKO70_10235 [Acidimicrobiia bacterium]|nr:hypothetical protein [Acidimicrobiia bacterium]